MNEEQKNIETCLAENILSEVASVPTDPQFRSLVEESFDPLQQQALQQAGYDGYKEVVMYHQPYTFTSQVKQMKSNLILLLRRLWRYPFGRGTSASSAAGSSAAGSAAAPIRSLADMWQHYITRLKGNPEYGIPSRLSQLTDLPSAPALLADRKIGGVPEAVDGMSLAQLICSAASSEITELTDSTIDWMPNKSYFTDKLASLFANLSAVTINSKEITIPPYETNYFGEIVYPNYSIIYGEGVERIYTAYAINKKDTDTFVLPKVKTIAPFKTTASGNIGTPVLSRAKNILAPELEEWCLGTYNACGIQGDELRKFYAPKLKGISRLYGDDANGFVGACPKLIHLEVGEGFVGWYGWEGYSTTRQLSGINLKKWVATMALRTDTDAEDYVDLREDMTFENNLQQFLQNFKTYIAERLTDNGKKLTITLSQEVRNAIHAAEDEYGIENIIITQKGWTISPAPN